MNIAKITNEVPFWFSSIFPFSFCKHFFFAFTEKNAVDFCIHLKTNSRFISFNLNTKCEITFDLFIQNCSHAIKLKKCSLLIVQSECFFAFCLRAF